MPVAGSVFTTWPQIRRKNNSSGSICHFSFSAILAVVPPLSSPAATPVSADKRATCSRVSGTASGARTWETLRDGLSGKVALRVDVLRGALLVVTFFFISE